MVALEVMTGAEEVQEVLEVSTFARKLREGESGLLTGGIPTKITWWPKLSDMVMYQFFTSK